MAGKTQIPDGWACARLGDLASLRTKQVIPLVSGDSPYVALENITSGGSLNGYRKAADSISNKTIFLRGDILYGKLRPNLRKVVQVNFDGVCSTDILAIAPNDQADGHFLGHVLQSDKLHEHAMRGITGTKMPRTSWAHLREFKFECPPPTEQRAIAAVLDSIDEAIERTEAVIAATEQLRDALLHDLLTRGVPGWHSEWKEVPGIGTIPASWEVVRLGDYVAEGPTNGIYKPESEYGAGKWLIRIDDFTSGKLTRLTGFKRIRVSDEESQRYAVLPRDILINRVNSLSHIGKSVLIPHLGEHTLFESNMMKVRMSTHVDPEFAMIVLLSKASRWYFATRAKKAVQQASINQQDVRSLLFPLPDTPREQALIVKTSVEFKTRIAHENTMLKKLRTMKESTADALLTGRVRISCGG